ncbi:MAG TPA: AraC family transcriptional regulator ligand-binding domain-containing protein [Terriglobales bacterium]|jgi:AraC-like DNA-binding protein|nr:AraC family transcriptional regulator ligand-binding domain-containing protein [Terriglobales bacterium]
MPSEYIHERSLNALVSAARSIGINVDSEKLAPTRRWLESDALVPAAEHAAVVHAILQDHRETLGIDLAVALPLESTGLWGFLLRSSADYGAMLRRAERYMRLVNRHQEFVLEDRGPLVALVSPHPDPSPYPRREQVVCVTLGHWITWGRQLTSHALPVLEARFRWPGPPDPGPFERFFGGQVIFGSHEDALLLDRRLCDLPLPESAPELVVRFEKYAASMIRQMQGQPDFVDSVRAALEEGILHGKGRQSDIARHLGITVRTLNRHLSTAKTSFHQLRDDLLRTRAEKFLAENEIPIAEVSYLLGYAEPSTFHRAFRRWTGQTPCQWRESTRVTSQM